MKHWRIGLTLCLLFLTPFCRPAPAHAEGPARDEDSCNKFERIQSIILSEATSQPLEAKLEVARVAVTKGACFLDDNFYSGYGVARFIADYEPSHCILSIHCRAYYMLYTIDPSIRESAAVAAYLALTEQPQIARFHFDAWDSDAYWWNSPSACPGGWHIIAQIKYC